VEATVDLEEHGPDYGGEGGDGFAALEEAL
jgi:hypothetical protein